MRYIPFSAFFGENSSFTHRTALLLPQAGLSLALLLAFTSASPDDVDMFEAVFNSDETYFRASDVILTDYARGVSLSYSSAGE
jgi:hypothetical protein